VISGEPFVSDPDFDPPPRKRPLWATLVIGLYGLLAALLLLGPLAMTIYDISAGSVLIVALIFFACGATLFIIPVPKGERERVVARRTIWAPLIVSSLLAALVCLGFTGAFFEFISERGSDSVAGVDSGALVALSVFTVWVGWLVLFGGLALSRGPESIGNRLWQALLVGSAAELLVAVPMHLVVRQRGYCCAGLMTGLGIALGATVLFLALGPAVFVLCYRRYRQVYARKRFDGE